MALPWQTTANGFEQQWQVNVLGHFLLCRLLLPVITDRIIHVSSGAHRLHPESIDYDLLAKEHTTSEGFQEWKAYGRSKLANILFSNELARRLSTTGTSTVTSNALHPGNVQTGLWAKLGRDNTTGISVQEGALTSIYLATSPKVKENTGGYCYLCKPVNTILDKELHQGWNYIQQSGTRAEISMSEDEGKKFWTMASQQVDLTEEL